MPMMITNNLSAIQANQTLRGTGGSLHDLSGMRGPRDGALTDGAALDKETQMKAAGGDETVTQVGQLQEITSRVALPVMQIIGSQTPILRQYPLGGEGGQASTGGTGGGFSGGATINGHLDLSGEVTVETETVQNNNGTSSTTTATDQHGNSMTKITNTDNAGNSSSETTNRNSNGDIVGRSTMAAEDPIGGDGDGDAGFFDPGYIPGRGSSGSDEAPVADNRRYIRPGDAWIDPPKVILNLGNELATQVSYLDSAIQNVKSNAGSGIESSKDSGATLSSLTKAVRSLGSTDQASMRGISRNDTARNQEFIGGISNLANNESAFQKGVHLNLFS
ncbi:MAG: hypothetical protein GY757_34430 [bacterium]|nr:hypothetical protein [bacterium]